MWHGEPIMNTERRARLGAPLPALLLGFFWLGPDTATGMANEAVFSPLGGGAGATLEPVPTDAARRQRLVFVCRDTRTPTYSDRPCGPSAEPHAVLLDQHDGGRPSRIAPEPARASPQPRHASAPAESRGPAPKASRCDRLRRQLDALDERMRSGYSAREAARLWTRWRDLRAELHARKC
jgi:hypothetical protein